MKKSETIGKISDALAKAHGAFLPLTKDKTATVGDKYTYKYAGLSDLIASVRGPLSAQGLAEVQDVSVDGPRVSITTVLIHSSGEWIEMSPLILIAAGGKPQEIGSLITYGRRYALAAALGMAPEDDDDANVVESAHRENANPRPPPQQAAKPSNAARKASCLEWLRQGGRDEDGIRAFVTNAIGRPVGEDLKLKNERELAALEEACSEAKRADAADRIAKAKEILQGSENG